MSDSNMGAWAWKIFTIALGVIIMPLAGWVWSMNVGVSDLHNDLGDLEARVTEMIQKQAEADANSKALISVKKDIEAIRLSVTATQTSVEKDIGNMKERLKDAFVRIEGDIKDIHEEVSDDQDKTLKTIRLLQRKN